MSTLSASQANRSMLDALRFIFKDNLLNLPNTIAEYYKFAKPYGGTKLFGKQIAESGFTLVVIILIFTAIILTAQYTTDLNEMIMLGDRSQQICGDNYLEYESARNKIYTYYTQSQDRIKNIKILFNFSFMLILLILGISYGFICIAGSITNNSTFELLSKRGFSLGMVIVLLVLLLVFYDHNGTAMLENKYATSYTTETETGRADRKNKEASMTPLLAITFITVLFLCFLNLIWINPAINDQTPTMFLLIPITIITVIFMFIINLNTKKINDEFISKYGAYANKINTALCNLGNEKKATIQGGVNDNKIVGDWIRQILANNIKRVYPEKGEPNLDFENCSSSNSDISNYTPKITDKDYYEKTKYAYIENNQGRELQELPDDKKIRNDVKTIRQNMWNMRNENGVMLKPVQTFVQQMRVFVLIMMFLLSFVVYHIAYVNYPITTKLTLVGIILVFTFFLMYSVIM